MYTVKQVATLTGVAEATLRVWERRYAVVSPSRTPGGYRLYDDNQVEALREMASLVEAGVPASRAADTVRGLPGSGVLGAPTTAGDADAPSAERPGADELVSAAASLEPSGEFGDQQRAGAGVDAELAVEGLCRHTLKRTPCPVDVCGGEGVHKRRRRVVDEDVDGSEGLLGGVEQRGNAVVVPEVGGDGDGLAAGTHDPVQHLGRIRPVVRALARGHAGIRRVLEGVIGQDDGAPVRREALGDGGSDAARATGDDCCFTL